MPDIQAIRERAAAAVPGPWRWGGNTEVNRVQLETAHSGRITVLSPDVRHVEYVFHHGHSEAYTLDEARDRVADWFGHSDELLERAQGFLSLELDPLDPTDVRHLVDDDRSAVLSRGVQHERDLRFGVNGRLRSYRDLARYEVLGGKTRAEAGLTATAGRADSPLYREDIVGIDTPEAAFIAHARQDVEDLLAEIDRLAGQAGATSPPAPSRRARRRTRSTTTVSVDAQPAAAAAAASTSRPVPELVVSIAATVRTRRVLYRGTKAAVAERLTTLPALTDEQVDAGVERYVEFTPTAVSETRWRIVLVSPPWTPEQIASTPSEAPGAPELRRLLAPEHEVEHAA